MNLSCFKILIILFLILSLTVLSASEIESQKTEFTLSDTIHIASEPDYPPYCFVNETGEAAGFSIDLFKAAAAAVDLDVKIKIGIWSRIKQDLAKGRIDALPLVGRTPEREEFYHFTMPYISLHGAVFVRKGTKDIHSLADLKHKSIVVMEGDNAEEFVRREKISDEIVTTKTFEEAFIALANGHHDAIITQRIMGLNLLEELKIKNVEALDFHIPQFRQDFCFAVQKGNAQLISRLNEGLSIIIADDTFEQIRNNWFGHTLKEHIAFKDVLRYLLIILIPFIIIIAVGAIILLRKEVKRQTEGLNKEIDEHKRTLKALQASEQKYRSMVVNLMEGFYSVTLDGRLLDYNLEFVKIFDLDPDKDHTGSNLPDFWQDPADRKIYVQELLEHGVIKNYEVNAQKTDGTRIVVMVNSRLVKAKSGQPVRIEGSFLDITKRKQAVEELQKLKDDLEELVARRTAELEEKVQKLDKSEKAMLYMVEDLNSLTGELKEERQKLLISNQELEAFTYSVSHDLRAPLRAVDGFSKFLLEDYATKLGEEGKRYIDVIRANALKMDKLITDLLSLSRISRANMNLTQVDMKEIAKSIYHEIASEEEKKAFQISIAEMPPAICDNTLIKQVWQNLISNALKYSSKSEVKQIVISALEEDDFVVFSIKDYGVGFNNIYMDKLFGVFQRLHSENEFPGTGVGLAIVKRIIQRHGGKVWAKGNIGKGAKFYFSLLRIEK